MHSLINDAFSFLEGHDLLYVALIIFLFVIPRMISRIGIPIGLGSFFIGLLISNFVTDFNNNDVVTTFATLGISALFLYAGLEVDFLEIKTNHRLLTQHLFIRSLVILIVISIISYLISTSIKDSALIALALLTPSTGFILDSIHATKLSDEQKKWIKLKAIAAEILALFLLLVVQSKDIYNTIFSFFVIGLTLVILPFIFHWGAKKAASKAPGSDFSLIILLAVLTGTLTKKLGAYYLVGAFIVGITVNFYKTRVENKSKKELEQASLFFASFFMPFYFFLAGLRVNTSMLTINSLLLALLFILISLPFKLSSICLQRKLMLNESLKESLPISISLLPTLVFSLVIVEILRSSSQVPSSILGAIIIYTIVMTFLPSILLHFLVKRSDLAEVFTTNTLFNKQSTFFTERLQEKDD